MSCRAASERRFVDEIGEVRAGKSGGAHGDLSQVDFRRQLDVPDVNPQHCFAPLDVRLVDEHLPVEAAGTEQRRVEHLGAIGRAHDDDGLARVEAVHLRQQLIECLLTLFVAANRTLHAHLAERVELVDEHDARRLRFGLRKQIADARRAHADEHLDELRSAQAEERHLGFARDGARQQRLAGARRADEQHALGNLAAELRVLPRRLEELDDLAQLLRRLVHARHIGKAHFDVVFGEDLGLAARKRHHAALGAANPPEEERPQRDEQHSGTTQLRTSGSQRLTTSPEYLTPCARAPRRAWDPRSAWC